MTSLEDCKAWLDDYFEESTDGKRFIVVDSLAFLLHQFSKTTIGHFPAEEEKQKAL